VRDANFEGAVKNCKIALRGAANNALLGSRELLRSAIENVLRNAVRYSPNDAPVEMQVARASSGARAAATAVAAGFANCVMSSSRLSRSKSGCARR